MAIAFLRVPFVNHAYIYSMVRSTYTIWVEHSSGIVSVLLAFAFDGNCNGSMHAFVFIWVHACVRVRSYFGKFIAF